MRLIDADALEEVMTGACDTFDKCGVDTTIARVVISCIDIAPTIEAEPAWKPATIKPKTDGEYLVLWGLPGEHLYGLYYRLLNYGTFTDYGDDGYETEKLGWWENDKDFGTGDFTKYVRYWTELPDKPGVEE